MARNSEKAMTALARWRLAHDDKLKEKKIERRPYLASECNDLGDAEKFHRQIIGEVSKKVAQIQNAGLGEYRVRDLNDEINKLLREKGHWEERIKEIGGPDYRKIGPKIMEREGREVPGNRGYKYFGAARDLPGVKELFEQIVEEKNRKPIGELKQFIDADYYGFRDEDDGILLPRETQAEEEAIKKKMDVYKTRKEAILRGEVPETITEADSEHFAEPLFKALKENNAILSDTSSLLPETKPTDLHLRRFVAHVQVPSQKEIEKALVERKKRELLEQYTSSILRSDTENTEQLLGRKTKEDSS